MKIERDEFWGAQLVRWRWGRFKLSRYRAREITRTLGLYWVKDYEWIQRTDGGPGYTKRTCWSVVLYLWRTDWTFSWRAK